MCSGTNVPAQTNVVGWAWKIWDVITRVQPQFSKPDSLITICVYLSPPRCFKAILAFSPDRGLLAEFSLLPVILFLVFLSCCCCSCSPSGCLDRFLSLIRFWNQSLVLTVTQHPHRSYRTSQGCQAKSVYTNLLFLVDRWYTGAVTLQLQRSFISLNHHWDVSTAWFEFSCGNFNWLATNHKVTQLVCITADKIRVEAKPCGLKNWPQGAEPKGMDLQRPSCCPEGSQGSLHQSGREVFHTWDWI